MAELTRTRIEAALVAARQIEDVLRPFAGLPAAIQVAADWLDVSECVQARLVSMQADLDRLTNQKQTAQEAFDRFAQQLTEQKVSERQRFETFQRDMKEARIAESDKLKTAEQAVASEQERVKEARMEYERLRRDIAEAERKMKDMAAELTRTR